MRITIDTDNDAFASGNKYGEVARILQAIARDLKNGAERTKYMDINGNSVAKIEY